MTIRAFLPGGVIAALLCAWYGYLRLSPADAVDLAPLVIAARLIATGHVDAIYVYEPGYLGIFDIPVWIEAAEAVGAPSSRYYGYLYPPLWAALLAPLTHWVGFAEIYWLVAPASFAAMPAIALIVAAQWNRDFLRGWRLVLCILALLASYPVYRSALLGQVQPIVMLLAVAAIVAVQRDRPALAGCVLALAAAVKVTPAILAIYWLVTRRHAAVLWFAGAGVVLAALSVLLAGWPAHEAYLAALARTGAGFPHGLPENVSFASIAGELLGPPPRTTQIVPIWPLPGWTKAVIAAIAIGIAAAIMRLARPVLELDALAMMGLLLLTTLAAPMAWQHYLFFLAAPLIVMAKDRTGVAVALTIAVLLSLPTVVWTSGLMQEGVIPALLASNGLIAALLVLASIIVRLGRPSSRPATA